MSRTFKRPMFRKGGNVGNGIMSGITDRVQAKAGYPDPTLDMIAEETVTTPNYTEEYIKAIREAGGTGPVGMDPLTSYLLTAGPAIAGATSFSDAISKLGDPNKALIERMQRAAEAERNLRIGATQFGLEKGFSEKEAEKDREIERQKISSAEKRARIMAEGKDPTLTLDEKITARAETLMEDYRNNRRYATNHATYIEDIQDKLPADKDKGIVKDSKTLEKIRQKGKKEEGNVYFDVTDGIAKELVLDEATGQYRWRDYLKAQETITDTTTVEDTGDKDTPAPKDYKTFIDEELKKQREKKRRELLEKYGVEDDLYSDFTSGQ